MNEKVSHLNDALNPSVLRLIQGVIRAAHDNGKWVGMCGEMAGQPHAVPILLGMGLDEFSMSSRSILRTRALISGLKQEQMKGLAAAVLQFGDAEEIKKARGTAGARNPGICLALPKKTCGFAQRVDCSLVW